MLKNLHKLLLIITCLLYTTISFSQTFTKNNIVYKVTSTNPNTVEITKETTATGGVAIPETVSNNGIEYTVTSIGDFAFFNRQLTSITIPNSVTSIGSGAFQWNLLINITIPVHVTSIGPTAFRENRLTHITIRNSAVTIGGYAFVNTSGAGANLTQIIVQGTKPSNLTETNIFGDRRNVNLIIPAGSKNAYKNAKWTGFKSITAPGNFTVDNISYKITATNPNTVEVISNSNDGDVTIPETVTNGGVEYSVTSIGKEAFKNNFLTRVTIPNSVTSIGENAFEYNQLTSVTIPNSVTSIAKYAFARNQLISATISNSLTTIGNHVFVSNNLTNIVIPEGVTTIDYGAFQGNELTSVTIPDSVTTIGLDAFRNNDLTSITIGSNVTLIAGEAFTDNKLTSITIPKSVTHIREAFKDNPLTQVISEGTVPANLFSLSFGDRTNINLIIPEGTEADYIAARWTGFKSSTEEAIDLFFTIDNITYKVTSTTLNTVEIIGATINTENFTIPATVTNNDINYNVTAIGDSAFKNGNLIDITIPNSVTTIGESAFENNQLTSITFSDNMTAIGNHVFENNNLTSITIPSNIVSIGSSAFASNKLTSITIPNSVTSMADHAFANNELTNITFSSNLTSIGDYVFYENKLTNITIPNSVTSIGKSAFENNQLTNITIPDSVTSIGDSVFNNNELTSATIGNNLTSISPFSFANNKLTSVTLGDSVTSIGKKSFFKNELISITIPTSITSIGESAFQNNKLTNITIPASITSMGANTFRDNELTNITLSGGLTTIGTSAFRNNKLTDVIIPASLTSMGGGAFANNKLTNVTLTDGLTSIAGSAFANNELTNIIIPASITYMGAYAFRYNKLTNVTLSDGLTSIGVSAFANNELTNIIIPNSIKSLPNYAFKNNQLTSITLSESITYINHGAFQYNKLTSVTLPKSLKTIKNYSFSGNPLTSVIAKGTKPATIMSDSFRYYSERINIALTIPEGTKADYITAEWTGFKSITESTNIPDDNFEAYLETHDASGNSVTLGDSNSMGNGVLNDDYVPTASIKNVISLDINTQNISNLTGIEAFTDLETLLCNGNNLSTLDLSLNGALQELYLQNNDLQVLNIASGNNTIITGFDIRNNANLTCVKVDNATYSTTNWTNKDTQTNYNENSCSIPVITLLGNPKETIEVGSTYNDAGATANDSFYGDITPNIIIVNPVDTSKLGVYTITYNISNSASNNAIEVTREVTVADTTIPVITLLGNAAVEVEEGSTYDDAGATASDSFDGDITSSIVVINPVNTSIPGTYTVTYNVSDAATNEAVEITREVTVKGTLSIEDSVFNSVTGYPNPAKDEFEISGLSNKVDIEIFNATGKHIMSIKEYQSEKINLQNLKSGLYFLRLISKDAMKIIKLIKE